MNMITLATINELVPKHSVLRYQDKVICSDDNHLGGLHVEFSGKEHRCKRCVLLDVLEEPYLLEQWGLNIVLDIYSLNVL
jgi:hypothetical protein